MSIKRVILPFPVGRSMHAIKKCTNTIAGLLVRPHALPATARSLMYMIYYIMKRESDYLRVLERRLRSGLSS